MATEDIAIKAKAGKLLKAGHAEFEGYRALSTDDLKRMIANAEKGGKVKSPAAKGSTNGSKGRAAATTAVKGKAAPAAPAKGKGSTAPVKDSTTKGKASPAKGKTAPAAQSKSQKSAPAKGAAAKGKASRPSTASPAKGKAAPARTGTRPAVAGKCKNHSRRKAQATAGIYANLCGECVEEAKAKRAFVKAANAKGKSAPAKGSKGKATPAKGKASTTPAKGKAAPAKRGKGKQIQGRSMIDRKTVNWKAESNVGGRGGKRGVVMAALRKRNGNYDKVFEDVKDNAVKWYPNALNSYPASPTRKHAAERMVRWLVNRVALDFCRATDQHEIGTRAGYGESDATQNVRRREQRAAARKEREKGTRGSKGGSGKGTPVRGRTAAQKGARGKAAPATGRKSASALKGKGRGKGK